jgi:hypothetical protein
VERIAEAQRFSAKLLSASGFSCQPRLRALPSICDLYGRYHKVAQ